MNILKELSLENNLHWHYHYRKLQSRWGIIQIHSVAIIFLNFVAKSLYIDVYICILMAKLIHVSDDVYEGLTLLKGKESYSHVIRKLLSQKRMKEKFLMFYGKGGVESTKVQELRSLWSKWSEKYV